VFAQYKSGQVATQVEADKKVELLQEVQAVPDKQMPF